MTAIQELESLSGGFMLFIL